MKKILIANRGEIAIRIARSVSDLGMIPVGIYSEDDDSSLHLTKMNENHKIIIIFSKFCIDSYRRRGWVRS